jgi:two-component system, sensor histidine kinase and response regulator
MATVEYFNNSISRFLKRRGSLIYLVIFISGLGLIGWLTGKIGLSSYSIDFFPIPHLSSIIFMALGIYFLIYLKAKILKSISITFLVFITALSIYLFLNYFFHFTRDIEGIFVAYPTTIKNQEIGRISPISSLLFIFTCIGLWGQIRSEKDLLTYVGCYSSLVVFIISTIVLIGYLYKAPLLYGSKIVPISMPSGINFFLFSFALIRYYDFRIWMFNYQHLDNQHTRQLIKSFLPVVIFLILLDGFLDARVSLYNVNPTLKSAIILISVIVITALLIIRVSAEVGKELLTKEKKLKENEIKFRTVADYTYDWEFWQSNDKRFIYNSPSCKRITGYDQKEFFMNPDLMTQIIYPEDLSVYENHLNEANNTKPCGGIDYRIITRTGEIRWLAHVCQPVFDENGTIIGRRGSGRDITTRMNAGIQIRELNKKLLSLNSDKDRFISILGHDLKSPFNNILGFSEILTNEIDSLTKAEINDIAKNINKSAKITNKLLEDILMWARTQHGNIPFKPQKLRFADITNTVLEILNPSAYAKNITIYSSPEDNISVYADIDMLKTIVLNLVSNAIKFTNSGGVIKINAKQNSENVTISISDNGVGIKTEDMVKMFDISQVLTTKGTAKETGTGLGLLLCKEFVEKHGGLIWVESEVGKGSEFKFTIPVSTQQPV